MEGNPKQAFTELDWEPKVKFHALVRDMLRADLEIVDEELKMQELKCE